MCWKISLVKADFEDQMNLAFGDGYDVNQTDVLVGSWENENLGFLCLVALLHKDRKYGNNKRVAQETYSKGRDE